MENLFVKEEAYQEIKRKMNKKDDYFTKQEMAEYTRLLQEHLVEQRHFTKTRFKIAGTIYRGVNNNRFTLEQGLNKLNSLGGNV